MVSAALGGLASRAYFLTSTHITQTTDHSTYAAHSYTAAQTLQGWYDSSTGLWDTTGWWNSANCLTVLADWACLDTSDSDTLNVSSIISNTFSNAQSTVPAIKKTLSVEGLITSNVVVPSSEKRAELEKRGYSGFINDYYDDEGWWALALIRSWDVTNNPGYLDMAEHIFADMMNGTDDTCGGGIWWSKERAYKNAIANELYLAVAANLANRVTGGDVDYLTIAKNQWTWFQNSGMINSNSNINDGLTINEDGTCVNNGNTVWTYNQGVVLGGLVELNRATGNSSYLAAAKNISLSAIALFADKTGVIHESCEPNCGIDGAQFKGVLMRNLQYLYKANNQSAIRTSILQNADSIWSNDRDSKDQFGVNWAGPASAGGGPNASTHSAAMDAVVAALAVC